MHPILASRDRLLLYLVAWIPISALLTGILIRLDLVRKCRHSLLGAILHPAGVLILLAIQWYAFVRELSGHPPGWKGRAYPKPPDSPVGTHPG